MIKYHTDLAQPFHWLNYSSHWECWGLTALWALSLSCLAMTQGHTSFLAEVGAQWPSYPASTQGDPDGPSWESAFHLLSSPASSAPPSCCCTEVCIWEPVSMEPTCNINKQWPGRPAQAQKGNSASGVLPVNVMNYMIKEIHKDFINGY